MYFPKKYSKFISPPQCAPRNYLSYCRCQWHPLLCLRLIDRSTWLCLPCSSYLFTKSENEATNTLNDLDREIPCTSKHSRQISSRVHEYKAHAYNWPVHNQYNSEIKLIQGMDAVFDACINRVVVRRFKGKTLITGILTSEGVVCMSVVCKSWSMQLMEV